MTYYLWFHLGKKRYLLRTKKEVTLLKTFTNNKQCRHFKRLLCSHRSNPRASDAAFTLGRSVSHLPQHLVVLHVVQLVGVDLPLQRVLVKLAGDVDQQRGGAGVDGAAQGDVAHVPRNVDGVAQDHADQKP